MSAPQQPAKPPRTGSAEFEPAEETLTSPAGGTEESAELSLSVVAGETIMLGPYRVVKELGRGGMGAVFAAIDTRLERRVALKVMLPQFAADPNAKARFLREARAAARIKHDNVVTVYEADERDGMAYIAMEYLEGYSLDKYLKKKQTLSIPQIIRIGSEAAAGLAAAHAIGLVHRDIKPANLWLEAPHGRVKVLDFGLAKPVHAETEVTQSGSIIGTPAYMSPEQARGQKVDHRTDLFSLGVLLYRLCAGRLPFEGASTMDLLIALGTEEPRPLRELNPAVPEALAALVHQLLAKKPDDRPQTAEEVRRRLRGIAQDLAAPSGRSGTIAHASSANATTPPATATTAQPAVVYVPIHVTALPQEENPFADIFAGNTATVAAQPPVAEAPPARPTRPARRPPARNLPWIYAALALCGALLMAGGVIIIIRNKDGSELKIEVPDGATVIVKDKNKTVGLFGPGGKTTPAAADPERKAAEVALSFGGVVRVLVHGEERNIHRPDELPRDRFTITGLNLTGKPVTDADLAHFQNCKNIVHLLLGYTQVSDAGLAYFKDCKNLEHLFLGHTQVSDAGLAYFKDCKNLTLLHLEQTRVTDAGLAYFKDCNNLTSLDVRGTQVGDKGLSYLRDKNLTLLIVSHTKVGDEGLSYFTDKGLRCLNIGYTPNVTRQGLARFLAAYKHPDKLDLLDLGGTPVTDADLAAFNNCQNLRQLYLGNTSVSDAGLAHFQNCKDLLVLHVGGTKVTDAGLVPFKDCKNLTSLVLGGTKVTDAGLAYFKDCKNLQRLELYATAVTDAGLAYFKGCKDLTQLVLQDTAISDVGLAYFRDCKGLRELNLKGTKVTAQGVEEFHAAVPGCRIEYDGGVREPKASADLDREAAEYALSVGGAVRINGEVRDIRNPDELPRDRFTLTGLILSRASITDAGLARFKDCKELTSLNLSFTQVGDAGLAHLQDCKNFRYLALSFTQVGDAGLAHFQGCGDLTVLLLQEVPATDAGLAHFKDCRHLQELNLGRTKVSDAGLEYLKGIKALAYLNIGGTAITDAGLAHLAACKNLTDLNIGGTAISDAGLAHLAACKNLVSLNLERTAISDAGLAHFKGNKSLAVLVLQDTAISDVGLANLKGCTGLRELNLKGTKVTAQGVEEFHTAVPGCRIEYDGGVRRPKASADLDREAAEYALSVGGAVRVNGEDRDIRNPAELPRDRFTLTGLNLISRPVKDEDLARFRDCTGLIYLNLPYTAITDAGLAHLRNCQNLRHIDVGGTTVGDAGLAHLRNCRELTAVYLGGTPVTDTGLGYVRDCPKLAVLYINGLRMMTDEGLAHFRGRTSLLAINLSGAAVTDKGLAYLKDCTNLRELNLSNTAVTDAGLAYFKNCKELLILNLDDTQIGDAGLAHFLDCKNLQQLRLTNTAVTDAGLASLKNHNNLRQLYLRGTKVMAQGVEEFHTAVPGCRIEYDGGVREPRN